MRRNPRRCGAEGVLCAQEVAHRAAALDVDMPITQAVCAVLAGGMTPAFAVEQLMGRDLKDE